MHRSRRLIVSLLALFALVAAACSSDSDDGATAATDDDAGESTAEVVDADDEPTTAAPTTTEASPEGTVLINDLQISIVEFGEDGFVEIVNSGDEDVDINGIWLCQFPSYVDLGTVVDGGLIAAGTSVQIPAGVAGGLDIAGGEAALYTSRDFGNSDEIFAYVQWGSGGGRADVAAGAGIWPPGASVTPDPEFGNIELFGDPADPESWS